MVTKMIKGCSEVLYKLFVKNFEDEMGIKHLKDDGERFDKHPYARYATDVIFQQANRPVGKMREANPFYSANHNLYGYKTEMSVLPNLVCIDVISHARGGVSDIETFKAKNLFHENDLEKEEEDGCINDLEENNDDK